MTTASEVIGATLAAAILAIGVQWAADRLAERLSDKVEAISEAIQTLSETIATPPRRTRTIAAASGTRLAYLVETNDEVQIAYTPVLAFVESDNSLWEPLVVIEGKPWVRDVDHFNDRVLLPGESLTDEQCLGMKGGTSRERSATA